MNTLLEETYEKLGISKVEEAFALFNQISDIASDVLGL